MYFGSVLQVKHEQQVLIIPGLPPYSAAQSHVQWGAIISPCRCRGEQISKVELEFHLAIQAQFVQDIPSKSSREFE